MMTGAEYIQSLRTLKTEVYFMGERVESVVDHPAMRPHVNAAAVTYDLAHDPVHRELARAVSHLTGRPINRWTHIPRDQEDLVKKVKMLRVAGGITGTCFQRCVGMDGLITLTASPARSTSGTVAAITPRQSIRAPQQAPT